MIKEVVRYTDEEFTYIFPPIEETIQKRKLKDGTYEVRYLSQDMNPITPNEWEDDAVFLVNYHRDFYITRDEIITKENVKNWYQDKRIPQEEDYYIFMLSCLVHGGVWLSLTYSFPCDPQGWDTSHVGVVLVSKEIAKDGEKARRQAQELVETWNQCLTGDVYILVREVYNADKERIDYDAVGGYYGKDYALKALKTEI